MSFCYGDSTLGYAFVTSSEGHCKLAVFPNSRFVRLKHWRNLELLADITWKRFQVPIHIYVTVL